MSFMDTGTIVDHSDLTTTDNSVVRDCAVLREIELMELIVHAALRRPL